jgi:hypothetical protein
MELFPLHKFEVLNIFINITFKLHTLTTMFLFSHYALQYVVLLMKKQNKKLV